MCFSVGVGINALPWFQPSDSGKEIVLRPWPRSLPVHSIRGRATDPGGAITRILSLSSTHPDTLEADLKKAWLLLGRKC
jgi:hypothetical protein